MLLVGPERGFRQLQFDNKREKKNLNLASLREEPMPRRATGLLLLGVVCYGAKARVVPASLREELLEPRHFAVFPDTIDATQHFQKLVDYLTARGGLASLVRGWRYEKRLKHKTREPYVLYHMPSSSKSTPQSRRPTTSQTPVWPTMG